MLREEWLNRVSLIIAIAGVLLIVLYSFNAKLVKVNIATITDELLEENVIVEGRIDKSYIVKSTLILELNDGTGKINCVKFNAGKEDAGLLHRNAFVKISGKVQLYKNELEIIIQEAQNA